MMFGYARVSTQPQNTDRQLDALRDYGVPVENIYQEKISGAKTTRPELSLLKRLLRTGDTLVIESLSRLSRSAKDLLSLVEEFKASGIKLVSLKEDLDMSSPNGKLLISVLSALSQFERDIIVQRTSEGLAAARARGRLGGRPRTDPKIIARALRMHDSKAHTIPEICAITGISQGTLYSSLKKRTKTAGEETRDNLTK